MNDVRGSWRVMHRVSGVIVIASVAVTMSLPSVGTAQTRQATTVTGPGDSPRAATVIDRRGPEQSIYIGAGAFTDPSAPAFGLGQGSTTERMGIGPAAVIALGWRFLPWLSTGLRLSYQYAPARDLPAPATTGKTDIITAGVYVRAYLGALFGSRWFDPWVSAGVDPAALAFVDTSFPNSRVVLTVYSVAIPVSAGFDVNLGQGWSVGVMGQVSPWFPHTRCGNLVETNQPSMCRTEPLEIATSLFAGVGLRYTMPQSPNARW